ncbi:hypothetical protein Leryth_014229 [Lithospermum erythrorhizon]|nr:hypothetical protein Leryth_014229 [Lithospermum erythrorhizon]
MNSLQSSLGERNVEQAIASVKRGSYLLKYGRRGKPKFCPFRLSSDETTLIWYVGKEEKQLHLNHVSKIIPGQRTAIFQRYPRPEKEYQSFSLIYGRRSLDVICKDKDEAEIWFVSLRELISQGNCQKGKTGFKCGSTSSDSSSALTRRNSQKSFTSSSSSDTRVEDQRKYQKSVFPFASPPHHRMGRALSDFILFDEPLTTSPHRDSVTNSSCSRSYGNFNDLNDRSSADTSRISFVSAISSSSLGSYLEDNDSLCDVFIWGEGIGNKVLGRGVHGCGNLSTSRINVNIGKAVESSLVFDAKKIACGKNHVVLVSKQGDVYSWGEGSGGRLGHGVEASIHNPKLIESLGGLKIELVACGEYHSCAISLSGEFYTWGDGIHNFGLLGHETKVAHWTPKKVKGPLEGLHVSFVSCGPWHSAVITSDGQLFTFGEGTFGALGHGDRESSSIPREVKLLKGLRTIRVSCGFWHSAAIVEDSPMLESSGGSLGRKLFTWGSGDEGQLGHGDNESRLVPYRVARLNESSLLQVACGHNLTVALTASGQVYAMGSTDYGKLGNPESDGKLPAKVQGKIKNVIIEEISCGSHHVAVLSSKSEVYTWGKGENGQLGHGDLNNRNTPTIVEALKDKQIKSITCGRNFTAAICLHRKVSMTDQSSCSRCHGPFNFRRKRHNCYNCGLVFCKSCTTRKSLKASLAPTTSTPYRVCDDCFLKINKDDSASNTLPPRGSNGNLPRVSSDERDRVSSDTKPLGILARLSSFDSLRRFDAKKNQKVEYPCDRSSTSSPSPSLFNFSEKVSLSEHVSKTDSPSASPFSMGSSPSHSVSVTSAFTDVAYPEETLDRENLSTDGLLKEISILKEQVEDLSRKSQSLEAELEKISRQLKGASKTAMEESEKNVAAKDVIKSLMMQLKDLSAGGHETTLCRASDQFAHNNNNSSSISSK